MELFIAIGIVIVLLVIALACFYILSQDVGGAGTFLLGMGALILAGLGFYKKVLPNIDSPGLLEFLSQNYLFIIGGFLAYLIVGILWSIYKWRKHVKSQRPRLETKHNDLVRNYPDYARQVEKNNLERPHLKQELLSEQDYIYEHMAPIMPDISQHKSELTGWWLFWPISVIGYVCGELARDLFKGIYNFLYNALHSAYESITRSVLGDLYVEKKKKDK